MSIKVDIQELQSINAEIKRQLESIKKLRESKKIVENRVIEFLKKEELYTVTDKTKGVAMLYDKKTYRVFEKSKKDRTAEAIELLRTNGVSDAENVYSRLKDIGRTSVEKGHLKFNKI